MITAEEALNNNKRCVEELKRRDGEYFTKYAKIIEDKINEANKNYGCTFVEFSVGFCIPHPVCYALKEYLTELGYKAWVFKDGDGKTSFNIWWDEKAIEEVKKYKRKTEDIEPVVNEYNSIFY